MAAAATLPQLRRALSQERVRMHRQTRQWGLPGSVPSPWAAAGWTLESYQVPLRQQRKASPPAMIVAALAARLAEASALQTRRPLLQQKRRPAQEAAARRLCL